MRIAVLAFLFATFSAGAQQIGVYHEASCPSVHQRRMTRLTRTAATERGLIPAADCHPDGPIRYLGILDLSPTALPPAPQATDPDKPVHVRPYVTAAGTEVPGYDRALPGHAAHPQ